MHFLSSKYARITFRAMASSRISFGKLYMSVSLDLLAGFKGSTAAAVPPPFRPSEPALCGSCPLVTPYYCRLGDLLCYNCMLYLSYHFVCMHVYFVFSLFCGLFPFVDFPSVLWYCWLGLLTCKNRLPYNLYCVGGDVKHCTIQSIFKLPAPKTMRLLNGHILRRNASNLTRSYLDFLNFPGEETRDPCLQGRGREREGMWRNPDPCLHGRGRGREGMWRD